MKKTLLIIIIVTISAAALWYFGNVQNEQATIINVPELVLESHDGQTISLNQIEGPLVVNSWASWCTFCKEELKDFKTLQGEFGNQVTFIAINRAEPLQKATEFTNVLEVEDSILFLLDPDDSFYKAIGGFTMPETIFVNASGEITIHKRGFMRLNEIRDKTNQII